MALQAPATPDVYRLVKCLEIGLSWHVPDLEAASNAKSFTICHRDDSGETNFLYPPDANIATCVINSINICQAMLANQKVRDAFTEIAEGYSQKYPDAWFPQEASLEHEGHINRVRDDFLQKIGEEFPVVFVDDSWANPRRMAAHLRRPWDGSFRSSNQYILVNGTVSGDRAHSPQKGA